MTGKPGHVAHIRNGAVTDAVLTDAFAELGVHDVAIEPIPGAEGAVEIHTPVAALLARLGEGGGDSAGASLRRLNATLWAHLRDPAIRLLLVDTETDITARLTPDLPERAHEALARLRLGTIDRFGIVAYDADRDAWVEVGRRGDLG
jgi:hypothetical protein